MRLNFFIVLIIGTLLSTQICNSQEEILYKRVDTTQLFLEVHYPPNMESSRSYPAMVFFFGGGWVGGNRSQFLHQAQYFAKRGVVCFLADYRTSKINGTTPFESVKDAKSAIRFIRKNATKFNIDGTKLIASGGSAGGHLAAATALVEGYNDPADDMSIDCIPNALILFNPVVDNGPGGYGYERIGESYKDFSPLHNIKKDAPSTILFLGTKDHLIPVVTAEYYKMVMEKVESRCDLKLYDGKGHGFFNYKDFESYKSTVAAADQFLVSLGYLKTEPIVNIE
ncbi:acetylxylan esterase precursor [Arenibacter sp. NBRC 103722]|uniref:Acetylxylan esterase n=1 Tax=Arenibacter algicola TaxID=616991 RepID=A0A221UZ19_9FLAO|nr:MULTISPECIES: alpha/beta hydrolase [Arenibacter]ASO06607.1 acetylxylan esterase [Arenibacter algicola]GBF20126.1 acetylxylan esterase precursor [Arenibacter sp. NBRC 103722]